MYKKYKVTILRSCNLYCFQTYNIKINTMSRFYIQSGVIRYSIKVEPINTNSNYNTSISIKMIGFKFPIWGTIIKSTDNAREYAKKTINSWVK